MDLIGRKGIDAVTMKEIAALSGGPIASVYQYFPNKSAIVAMLYERYEEDALEIVRHHCSAIENENDVFAAVDAMINAYYQAVKDVPATQDLINAIQADKELANLDIAGSRAHSRIFVDVTAGFVADDRREHYARAAFRSEEHTSELQSLMRISYAVFCLKKKKINNNISESDLKRIKPHRQ